MIKTIIKKELLENVQNMRFPLFIMIIFGMMITTGLFFINKYEQNQKEYREGFFNNGRQLAANNKSLSNILSFEQTLTTTPNPLRIMVDGNESVLPNSVQLSVMDLSNIENTGSSNPFFLNSREIDITFIVQLIMSFIAIILTFNTVCGEKENGTLRLCLSNPLPRDILLLGKYISSMIILIIPFIIGTIIDFIIISLSKSITLDFSQWLNLAALVLVSVLYISIFVLLGIAVSAKCKSTTVSLVLLLLVWIGLVVLIPYNLGSILANKQYSIPTAAEIENEAGRASREVVESYPKEYGKNYDVGDPRNARHVAMSMEAHKAAQTVLDNYRLKKINSVESIRNITRISPSAVYQYASEALAGTGLAHVKHFLRAVESYKNDLASFFQEQDSRDPESQHLYYHPDYVSHKPFDPAAVPKFVEPSMGIAEGLRTALIDILILVLTNIILFAVAFVSFLRYDVR
jgi:ABC-type transport system involved in multi-copper enzyme maturation permease subunit